MTTADKQVWPLTRGLRHHDADNSKRLIHLHGEHLRFVPQWDKWIVWNGTRWVVDHQDVMVTELAKDVSRALYMQASTVDSEQLADQISRFARTSANRQRINAMIKLARGINGVTVTPDELDVDPWLLGVQNGAVDLRTGRLQDADPLDLMTMQAPAVYDLAAECPTWERCLTEWFPDPQVRDYVQRLAGQAIVGNQQEHLLVIHFGPGGNGKGTFVRALAHVLGEYYVVPHKSLLVVQKHAVHDTERAKLYRKRLAVGVETDQRQKLNEADIKNLTGGDIISARRMREDPWEFTPTHTLWLQTNHLPEIASRDNGIWRRMRVVEWTATFSGKSQDATLDEKLRAEASGILNWLITGALAWQQNGLSEPPAIEAATHRYRRSEDLLTRFAQDVDLVVGSDLRTTAYELRLSLDEWCRSEGVPAAPSSNALAAWLTEQGATRTRRRLEGRTNKSTIWEGIGLRQARAESQPQQLATPVRPLP
jgi:putative DNA primase/helicase